MDKERIFDDQGISLVVLLLIGSNSIMATGLSAEKDIWLSIILAMFIALPMMIIYARIHYVFPNKDLFDIIEICFGKFLGKVIILIIIWYIFEDIASIERLFSQFIVTVSLTYTKKIVIEISIMILCIWIVKEGVEIMCRWSKLFVLLIISMLFFLIISLIPDININNIRPILNNGIEPVLKGAFETFLFPFAQTITVTMIFSSFTKKKSPYKVYTLGLLIGGVVVFFTSLVVVLVLGVDSASSLYYPSYATAARIDIGGSVQRIEVIPGAIFSLGAFIKMSIYLLATCKGIAKLFECIDYRFIVVPIAISAINLSYFEFDGIMHYFEWSSEIWNYYIIPYQVMLPIIIWIVAEIKKKRTDNISIKL